LLQTSLCNLMYYFALAVSFSLGLIIGVIIVVHLVSDITHKLKK